MLFQLHHSGRCTYPLFFYSSLDQFYTQYYFNATHWLLSHNTIFETIDSSEREMIPIATKAITERDHSPPPPPPPPPPVLAKICRSNALDNNDLVKFTSSMGNNSATNDSMVMKIAHAELYTTSNIVCKLEFSTCNTVGLFLWTTIIQ